MTSSLLISHCDVPLRSVVADSDETYDEVRCLDNLFLGRRYLYSQLETAAAGANITFTLPDGETADVDHFIVGGDSQLIADEVDGLMLQKASDPAGPWTDIAGFDSADPYYTDAVAPNADLGDKLLTFTEDSASYFRLALSKSSGTSKFPFSKFYFGKFFDIGQDPHDFQYPQEEILPGVLRSPSGKREPGRIQHPIYRFEITWRLITDAKAHEFQRKFLDDPLRRHVYLYTPTVTNILNEQGLAFCELVQEESYVRPLKDNVNEVFAVFREVR